MILKIFLRVFILLFLYVPFIMEAENAVKPDSILHFQSIKRFSSMSHLHLQPVSASHKGRCFALFRELPEKGRKKEL